MAKKLHIIYVPGLGDRKVVAQQRVVSMWSWWGVEPELFQMNWGDKEPWSPKFQRLLARIDELVKEGKPVGLVGASAGASAIINAYAAHKNQLVGIVCIAGKINRPQAIANRYSKNNPAFITSAHDCEQALKTLEPADRRRILSRFAVFDGIVPHVDSRVPGARNRLSPTIGHPTTIAAQITFGAPGFLRFLKRQADMR
jgi:predicted alpha/beta hydrolase family esterase